MVIHSVRRKLNASVNYPLFQSFLLHTMLANTSGSDIYIFKSQKDG